jgi:uncharacterized protein
MSAAMNMGGERGKKEKERDRLKSVSLKAALAALRIYKVYLSFLFAGSCRFEPTCSVYAYEAIERFGVIRGSWLGWKRLLRCQPLSRKFGYDPVPQKTEATGSQFRYDAVSEKTEVRALESGGAGQDGGRAGAAPREAHS